MGIFHAAHELPSFSALYNYGKQYIGVANEFGETIFIKGETEVKQIN